MPVYRSPSELGGLSLLWSWSLISPFSPPSPSSLPQPPPPPSPPSPPSPPLPASLSLPFPSSSFAFSAWLLNLSWLLFGPKKFVIGVWPATRCRVCHLCRWVTCLMGGSLGLSQLGGGRLPTAKCARKQSSEGSFVGLITFVHGSSVGKYLREFSRCDLLKSEHLLKNSGHCLSQLAWELELQAVQYLLVVLLQALIQWSPLHVPQVSLLAKHWLA